MVCRYLFYGDSGRHHIDVAQKQEMSFVVLPNIDDLDPRYINSFRDFKLSDLDSEIAESLTRYSSGQGYDVTELGEGLQALTFCKYN